MAFRKILSPHFEKYLLRSWNLQDTGMLELLHVISATELKLTGYRYVRIATCISPLYKQNTQWNSIFRTFILKFWLFTIFCKNCNFQTDSTLWGVGTASKLCTPWPIVMILVYMDRETRTYTMVVDNTILWDGCWYQYYGSGNWIWKVEGLGFLFHHLYIGFLSHHLCNAFWLEANIWVLSHFSSHFVHSTCR